MQAQGQTPRDPFSNPGQFSRNLDDYRRGGQGIAGQLLGDRPLQSGSQDDYSNLGDAESVDSSSERRGSVMQHNNYGLLNNGLGPNQPTSLRNPLSNPQSESGRITSPHTSATGGKLSLYRLQNVPRLILLASRSPLPQDQKGVIGQDRFVSIIDEVP